MAPGQEAFALCNERVMLWLIGAVLHRHVTHTVQTTRRLGLCHQTYTRTRTALSLRPAVLPSVGTIGLGRVACQGETTQDVDSSGLDQIWVQTPPIGED